MRIATCFFASVAAMFGQVSAPTPAELIQRAMDAFKAQSDRKYTYREDHIQSQIEKDGSVGKPRTETYEHIMLEGSNYRKLILIEGNQLDAKTQKRVNADIERARGERRKLLSITRTVSSGGLELLKRLFDNTVTGEESLRGRKSWRMESEPKPGYKAANPAEDEALATRRVYWFDEESGHQIQEHSIFIRAAKGFQPGSTTDVEFGRVDDAWLPSEMTMRADVKFVPGMYGRVESHQKYYGYRRFMVDSTMTPE